MRVMKARTIAPFDFGCFRVDAFFVFVVLRTDVAAGPVVGLDAGLLFLVVPLDDAAFHLHRIRHQVHYDVSESLIVTRIRHGLGCERPRPIEAATLDPGGIFFRHGKNKRLALGLSIVLLQWGLVCVCVCGC